MSFRAKVFIDGVRALANHWEKMLHRMMFVLKKSIEILMSAASVFFSLLTDRDALFG